VTQIGSASMPREFEGRLKRSEKENSGIKKLLR
jgi:hypothetical protein